MHVSDEALAAPAPQPQPQRPKTHHEPWLPNCGLLPIALT